jgi:hypothetical protein
MKAKVKSFVYTSLHVLALMLLSLYLFWHGYAKHYIERFIKTEYGQTIIKTYNNTELIKNFDLPVKSDDKSTN